MNSKYRDALPLLQSKLQVQVEEITALDLFYTDGDSRVRNSFFKLIFPKAVVYIYEGGLWISYGGLTNEESFAIHDWIAERGRCGKKS
jgi:hypothetical protein